MRSASQKIDAPEDVNLPSSQRFWQSLAKLYRARQHAHELSLIWEKAVEMHYAAARGEPVELPYEQDGNLLTPPIPIAVSLALGDTIRNLRSALDYLVSDLARSASLSDSQTIFPFGEQRSKIQASFNPEDKGTKGRRDKRAGAFHELSQKYPALEDLILNRIKPYSKEYGSNARGDLLWRIITADNTDKHQLITPSVQRARPIDIQTTTGARVFGFTTVGSPIMFSGNAKLLPNSEISVDIVFDEPFRLSGRPVTTTLIDSCNAVEEVIHLFADTFAHA